MGMINVQLFHKLNPEGGWNALDGFDLPSDAIPRVGDAFRYGRRLWRAVDVIWDFDKLQPDGSVVEYVVELNVEAGME